MFMKILFIAPIPPPINGQSLASQVIYNELRYSHEVNLVNTSKKKSKSIAAKIKRVFEVTRVQFQIIVKCYKSRVIYLTISESIAGNLKDILTYILCFRYLNRMYIHLHGGAGMINILQGKNKVMRRINAMFLKRVKGVIILGESHKKVFEGYVAPDKIHIVPNFAEDYLFIDKADIVKKFEGVEKLELLFLSNLIYGKGYLELLESYLSLEPHVQEQITLNFAGAFGGDADKREFLSKTEGNSNILYHGVVRGDKKKVLFHKAHVFCLPTYYPFEGQPISILEAYASGCVVVTTNHSGIRDVFTDGKNGVEVEKKSISSLRTALEELVINKAKHVDTATQNREEGERLYRTSIYNESLKNIIGL